MTLISIHDLVAHQASRNPEKTALSSRGLTSSYGELWQQIRAVSGRLHAAGLRPDDRVAVYLEKRPETVAACFGATLAGGVFVPVNPLLRDEQVLHVVNDCSATFLVTSGARLQALDSTLSQNRSLTRILVVDEYTESDQTRQSVEPWPSAALAKTDSRWPTRIDTDMAAILYTSGSTGLPKGVVLSHRNLLAGALSVSHYIENTSDDRILAALPLSFDAGLSQVTTAFAVGATAVLHNYLAARDLVKVFVDDRITGLTGVPPLWNQLAQQEWPADAAAGLRYFANTGGHLPRPTLDRLRGIFPRAKPFLMYGLTEAFRSTYLDPGEIDRRPDSIGKAIPNAEILVVRSDGTRCDPEEEGELVHRGALVALGYWNDPVRTAERFRPAPGRPSEVTMVEPAVWSGDRVRMDDEGFLYFVGRSDGMIKASGYRVSPTEVEEVVLGAGNIEQAAAVGIPHPELGQTIVVAVTPAPGNTVDPAAILARCRARLPLFMVPNEIVVRHTLPQTPSGKLDRVRLSQELLAREAGREHA